MANISKNSFRSFEGPSSNGWFYAYYAAHDALKDQNLAIFPESEMASHFKLDELWHILVVPNGLPYFLLQLLDNDPCLLSEHDLPIL